MLILERQCFYPLALVACIWSSSTLAKDSNTLAGPDRAIYDSLKAPQIDTNAVYLVRAGSEWQTGAGSYRFESGIMTFLTPVTGRPSGCHFEGIGTFHYAPPSSIERGQLYRFYKDSTLETGFTELFIRFFDSATQTDLRACCQPGMARTQTKHSVIRGWANQMDDDLVTDFSAKAWLWTLRAPAPRAFLAVTGKYDVDPLYVVINEELQEAITVYRKSPLVFGKGAVDVVCSYDCVRTSEEEANSEDIAGRGFAIRRYDSDVTIKSSTEMAIDVDVTCLSRRDEMRGFHFSMADKLEIDSIWVNGELAMHAYREDYGDLSIKSPQALASQDTAVIRMLYRGKELLYKDPWGDFWISYTSSWMPRTDYRTRADYETVFRFPKYYELVSSGQLVSDTVEGDWRIKHWRTYNPSSYISFNYGSFDLLSWQMTDGPRLDVYRSKNHLQGLFGGNIKKAVGADIEGAIQLFTESFGHYPWPHLAATEIPDEHGQGLPQLLHLSWSSFESNEKGVTDAFRAHEVAHQWFGHLVNWGNYHDQWLSEGFAEYAGAMYVQARHPGNKVFYDLVKQWRKDILEVGGHGTWHSGPYVAPIWLGYRCASAASPASYYQLVYSKGAYVLHMLRNMLHDYQRGSDARFIAMMREYVTTFSYREATTEDFKRVVERHFGEPMDWFFDQWVYGIQIPRFEYKWDLVNTPDGKWVITGSIEQFDVDSTFRTVMPITLVFNEGRRTFLQDVSGPQTTFTTPPLELKPKDLVFDDHWTILCKERTVEKPK